MSLGMLAGIIFGIALFGTGWAIGYRFPTKRYWDGYTRGYRQCEIDIYGLPDEGIVEIRQ